MERICYDGIVTRDLIGIAFAAFADPSMPWPMASVWETTRHSWVTFDHELHHFERQFERAEGPATAHRYEPDGISPRVRTVSIPAHIRNSG